MTANPLSTDVVVIGAGPVGLFTVFQCGMAKLQCHVIDALEDVGGQCAALYPEKPIYDIPAFTSITGGDLIERLHAQAAPFGPTYHLAQRAEKLEKTDSGRFLVTTSAGTRIESGAVIIAAGAGAFGPNRPPMENLEAYEGTSVFYMVRKREDFRNKRVVIAGGGDSAVDWALSLAEVAKSVQVVHRRPKFRAAPDSVDKLHKLADAGTIELVVPYQLKGLKGDGTTLDAVTVTTMEGETRDLEADVLLPFFGLATDLGPIAAWGLGVTQHHIEVDPTTCETSEPGIFAVGDICHYPHKLKLILAGFAEGAAAAHAAYGAVHPGEALHFEHSTTAGVPVK